MATKPTPKLQNSAESTDGRAIGRIIMEKAAFGAIPLEFKIESHHNWHTVQWMHHPELFAVKFSDGSVIYVQHAAGLMNQEMEGRAPSTVPAFPRSPETPSQLAHHSDEDDSYDDMMRDAAERHTESAVNDAFENFNGDDTPATKPNDPIADALKSFGLGTKNNKE